MAKKKKKMIKNLLSNSNEISTAQKYDPISLMFGRKQNYLRELRK